MSRTTAGSSEPGATYWVVTAVVAIPLVLIVVFMTLVLASTARRIWFWADMISVPPGAEELSPCPDQSFAVEELRTVGRPGCDMEGSQVVFPTGVSLDISDVGHSQGWSSSADPHELGLNNWGVPGVGADLSDGKGNITVWATSDWARSLQCESVLIGNDVELDAVDGCEF